MSSGFAIRAARREELRSLIVIERAAGRRFRDVPELADLAEDLTPLAELETARDDDLVWVAEVDRETVVGFAYASILDGNLHLEELSVLPEWGRRGIGKALVHAVVERARSLGLRAVTLTTFRDVPWNAPFYARLGFEVLDQPRWSPGLAAAFRDEARRGLPTELRVVMRRPVGISD